MSFARVGYEEAMRRARDIVPTLRERAQKCEDTRVLLPENEKLLHETGLFRFHQPKRFGGMELPFVAIVDIVAELARGCPSTAWNVGNLGCHHWILGYYEPETQHEMGREPGRAHRLLDRARRGPRPQGGWRFVVSGRWPFSSGVDNSGWNMLAVTIYEGERGRLAALRGAEERLQGDRHLVCDGHDRHRLEGRGSARGVRARAARAAAHALPRRPGAPRRGAERGRALRHPLVAASGHPLAGAALGAAEGAFEHVHETFRKRTGTYTGAKVSDFQAVQIKLARALPG